MPKVSVKYEITGERNHPRNVAHTPILIVSARRYTKPLTLNVTVLVRKAFD
jgi:hypothetical protein